MTGGRFLRASEAIAVLGVLRDLPGQVAFDAVSIRTNTSGDARMSIGTRGRTYSATNAPLRRVIAEAFSLPFRPPPCPRPRRESWDPAHRGSTRPSPAVASGLRRLRECSSSSRDVKSWIGQV
jgi:hypothetical protein